MIKGKDMDVQISVIVPVYKVEKYLDKCIKSILNQTFKDFELILVDDGSPDSCPEICDRYANLYNNIRVVHKENGGLSDARNSGVQLAKGKQVTFIDSDDFVDEDYLQELIDLKRTFNADICVVGIQMVHDNEKITSNIENIKRRNFTGLQALENMLYQQTLDTSACAILLPVELAAKYPFPVGKYHEDDFTTYQYYPEVSTVAVSNRPLYFYLQRESSIMHTFGQANIDELDAADNLVSVCKTFWPDLVNAANSKKFSDYCQVLLNNPSLKLVNPDAYKRITDYLKKIKWTMLFDRKARLKNRMAAAALIGGVKSLFFLNRAKEKINKDR